MRATLFLIVVLLGGCGSNLPHISNVFDDLTNETISKSTLAVEYRSFLSLSGLAPVQSLGMFAHHPSGVSPTHAVGISPKWSFYTESSYKAADITEKQMADLETAYSKINSLAGVVAGLSARYTLVKAAIDQKNFEVASEILEIACADNCVNVFSDPLAKLEQAVSKASDDLVKAKIEFSEKSNLRNVIFMRWNFDGEESGRLGAGQTVVAEGRKREGKSGLAIFGGLRVLTLYFGEDFIDAVTRYESLSERVVFTRASVVSHIVQAKQVKYLADSTVESRFELTAKISRSRIAALKTLLSLQDTPEIDANYVSTLVADVGNKGFLSNPVVTAKPFCFFPPRLQQDLVMEGITENYSTVYAVKSQLSLLAAMLLKGPKTDLRAIMDIPDPIKRKSLLDQYESQCQMSGKAWSIFDSQNPPFGKWMNLEY